MSAKTRSRKRKSENGSPNAKRIAGEFLDECRHLDAPVVAVENAFQRASALACHFTRRTLPYGGNGSLRPASLQRVLQTMQVSLDECFIDLGCGPGNVLAFALTLFPEIRCAIGYEYNANVIMQGSVLLRKAAKNVQQRCKLIEADLCKLDDLLPAEQQQQACSVFAYDRVMNREALANVAQLINRQKPRVFASFQTPATWSDLQLEFEHFETVSGCKTTGNQSFTCYLFRERRI